MDTTTTLAKYISTDSAADAELGQLAFDYFKSATTGTEFDLLYEAARAAFQKAFADRDSAVMKGNARARLKRMTDRAIAAGYRVPDGSKRRKQKATNLREKFDAIERDAGLQAEFLAWFATLQPVTLAEAT